MLWSSISLHAPAPACSSQRMLQQNISHDCRSIQTTSNLWSQTKANWDDVGQLWMGTWSPLLRRPASFYLLSSEWKQRHEKALQWTNIAAKMIEFLSISHSRSRQIKTYETQINKIDRMDKIMGSDKEMLSSLMYDWRVGNGIFQSQ